MPRFSPMTRPTAALLLALALASGAGPVHAGLFDDDEARKAILDLRARIAAVEEAGRSRAGELATANTQLAEQLTGLRRSLLELNNQLESTRSELARLRGSDEQLLREVSELQRGQRDVSQALEERLRRLEPVKVSIDGRDAQVGADEKKAFDDAVASIRSGDFDKAVGLLSAFQRRYPGSAYGDTARFWMGNALYGKRDYKEAISAFRAFVSASAGHPRAPEALLALANSQAEMKDTKGARRTLDELVKAYPQSEAAQAGKERMASIK